MNTPKPHLRSVVRIGGLILLLVLGTLYLAHQSRLYRAGITLEVETPQPGIVVTNPFLTVRGKAENVSRLSMNGRQIFVDEENVFEEKLLMAPGYSIITITARDRFNREKEQQIDVVYKEPNQ